jgi:hypothetical protein
MDRHRITFGSSREKENKTLGFKPNRKFKRKYDRLYRQDPLAANTFLLLCELADEKGQVIITDETKIAELMAARFKDIEKYQL